MPGFNKPGDYMKPQAAICAECTLPIDTIELVNGEERRRLCFDCISEELADMVLSNAQLSIINHGDRLEIE
jgi:hypothetical protein